MRVLVVHWTAERIGGAERVVEWSIDALRRVGVTVGFASESGRVGQLGRGGDIVNLDDVGAWSPDVVLSHGVMDPEVEVRLSVEWPLVAFVHSYRGMCISGAKFHARYPRKVCESPLGSPCLAHYFPRGCGGRNPITMIRDYRTQLARRGALKAADLVVVHSEYMRTECARNGVAAQLERLPFELPAEPRAPSGVPQVAFVGRFLREKGGEVLLRAWADVVAATPNAVLHLIGDGPDDERWRNLAARLSGVVFHGPLSPHARDEIVGRCVALVVPSVWPEPFGLVGLEAARLGTPSVAFRVGGIPDWLSHDISGFLVSPGSVRELARALVRVQSPTEQRRLREGAAEQYRRWQQRQLNPERLLEMVADVAARRSGRGSPRHR